MEEATSAGLQEAVIFLAAAAVMVPLFSRARLGAVLGYLAAGLLIGPHGFGLIAEIEDVLAFGEYGIVLLLFVIGMELQPQRLWSLRRDIFGLGTLQVVLTGLALTAALLSLTSLSWQSGLVVGLSLALSSTALVVQFLQEAGELNTREGERAFSILLMQDLAIVPLLIIVSALSREPGASGGGWTVVAAGFGSLLALVVLGRFLLNPAMRMFGQVGSRDMFVIAALLTVLGASYLMASFGLSMALGAFVAGVMLADSPYRHELESVVEPFRGLLMGLFFLAVGMTIDVSVLVDHPLRVLKLVLMVLVLKTLVIGTLVRIFGTPTVKSLQTGLLLSQGGEFAFVLLGAAVAGLLIAPAAASLFTAVVTLSMIASLILVKLYRLVLARLPRRPAAPEDMMAPQPGQPGGVIVIGYGRFGQVVTQMLHARGAPVVLIDSQPAQIMRSRRFGWEVFYGDGFRPDILRQAGAGEARLLIVTTGGAWPPSRLAPVRAAFPNLEILVRAHDRRHYIELMAAGLDITAVQELLHGAIELGRIALADIGTPDETVNEVTREFRRRDSEQLALQIASGDTTAGVDTVFRPDQQWQPEDVATSLGEIPPAEVDEG